MHSGHRFATLSLQFEMIWTTNLDFDDYQSVNCFCDDSLLHVLQCVHVAGTKGKGSVVGMLASILRKAKLKVGTYTRLVIIAS